MDNLETEKVNTIIKRCSKEVFLPVVCNENNCLPAKSQKGRRLQSNSLQLSLSSKTGDSAPGNSGTSMEFQDNVQKEHYYDPSELSVQPRAHSSDGPHMLPLIPIPKSQGYGSKASIVLNGTASSGITGPPVGAVDIGVSKCAYYFRVALPGVKKDPGDFSCEIELDGRVHIHGVTTTGGETVTRHTRVYNMQFRQQCPPGPFTLSFCLPGPVDPRMFSPNFRTDGIFEAVVLKYEQ